MSGLVWTGLVWSGQYTTLFQLPTWLFLFSQTLTTDDYYNYNNSFFFSRPVVEASLRDGLIMPTAMARRHGEGEHGFENTLTFNRTFVKGLEKYNYNNLNFTMWMGISGLIICQEQKGK